MSRGEKPSKHSLPATANSDGEDDGATINKPLKFKKLGKIVKKSEEDKSCDPVQSEGVNADQEAAPATAEEFIDLTETQHTALHRDLFHELHDQNTEENGAVMPDVIEKKDDPLVREGQARRARALGVGKSEWYAVSQRSPQAIENYLQSLGAAPTSGGASSSGITRGT